MQLYSTTTKSCTLWTVQTHLSHICTHKHGAPPYMRTHTKKAHHMQKQVFFSTLVWEREQRIQSDKKKFNFSLFWGGGNWGYATPGVVVKASTMTNGNSSSSSSSSSLVMFPKAPHLDGASLNIIRCWNVSRLKRREFFISPQRSFFLICVQCGDLCLFFLRNDGDFFPSFCAIMATFFLRREAIKIAMGAIFFSKKGEEDLLKTKRRGAPKRIPEQFKCDFFSWTWKRERERERERERDKKSRYCS